MSLTFGHMSNIGPKLFLGPTMSLIFLLYYGVIFYSIGVSLLVILFKPRENHMRKGDIYSYP